MKISIITVCYNSEKTIEKTLNSVLNQTYSNYEYIIIDGASSDDTISIVNKYIPKFNGKLKVYSEPDKGIYDAMNKGIKKCTGDIIGMVNSDDYYESDTLQIVAESYLGNSNHEIYYGMIRCVNSNKEEKIVLYNHLFLDKQMIAHPACFVGRSVYEDFGLYDTSYKSSADYEFMLRIYHDTDTKFIPIYKILSNFEINGMSSSEVGYRETASILLNRGIISRKRYIFILMKSILRIFFDGKWLSMFGKSKNYVNNYDYVGS